jgi:hypothetical protein
VGRLTLADAVRRELRTVGIVASVGILTGVVVGGVGSRLAMRAIAATSDPRLDGVLTSDREPIGDITLDGTIGLVLFVGVFGGVLLGVGYLLLRSFLPDDLRVRAACAAGLVWCVGASTMFDSSDFDFRMLEPGWLSIVMFSAIFLVAGWVAAAGIEVALRSWPAPGRAAAWRYAPALLLLPFFPLLGLLLVVALVRAVQQVVPSGRAPLALVVAGRVALVVGAVVLAVPAIGEVVAIV